MECVTITGPTGEAPEDWLNNIKTEMESCEKHRDEYLSEKASYDMFITRIDCLLRWIDYATKAFPASNSPEYFRMVEERVGMRDEGPCSDVDDFFRRTDRFEGSLREYNDSNVMRFVETVTIHPDKITLKFKAGIEI